MKCEEKISKNSRADKISGVHFVRIIVREVVLAGRMLSSTAEPQSPVV